MNISSPEKIETIKQFLRNGVSVRGVCARTASAKNTVLRYRAELLRDNGPVFCQCGAIAGHRGWCSFRVLQSPARQDFLSKWTRTSIILVRRSIENKVCLPQRIDAMLPHGFPLEVRDDLKNDLVVAVLSGELSLAEAGARLKKIAARAKTFMHNKFRDISIYAPLQGTNGLTLADILAQPDERY